MRTFCEQLLFVFVVKLRENTCLADFNKDRHRKNQTMSIESLFEHILLTEQQVSENIRQLHEGNVKLTVNM